MQKELRKSLKEVHKNTPTVSVYSNQGLVVRGLGYYRRVADEEAAIRISLQRYNNAGQLTSSVDPRLSVAYLKNPTAVIPNQQQQNTLSGNVLQSQNVDAGTRVFFSDVRGQALWGWDSRGTINEFEYDKLHRITAVYEKARSKEFYSERLSYGIAGDSLVGNNGVGRLSEHYDTAGRRVIPEYSLLGQVRTEVQFFIKAGEVGHWVEDAVENEKYLETTGYTSAWTYTALGEVIGQRDAQGNERGTVYDVAGQVSETWLQLKENEKKTLSERRVYNASGQLQEERLGNGIGMNYRYEAKTQRLSEKEAKRLSDNTLLQSLHYTYDPVGNILSITDKAEAETIDFYKNNKAEAISRYTYDSFYQLIVADGIENEQAGQRGKKNTIVFGNKDASRVVNYQRSYDYDAGGNLLEIGQLGANPAMKLTIDTQSNRGIEQRESGPSLQESFDANGNLLYINTGQPLSWDNRNQLQESVQVEREGISDKEIYLYDGQGSRIQKTRTYLAESQIHTERVRYLPGIELREHWQTDLQGENQQNKERLFLIQAQAGDAPVKALHWELGQPSEIENDGMYYTLTDQIGSSQIELDEIGELINYEAYYPYGGTAIWTTKNQVVSNYKYRRYSGKERDHSGLYYYGYRYYLPWLGRWLNPDPSGISQGLNLFEMVSNNPITYSDVDGKVFEYLKNRNTQQTISKGDISALKGKGPFGLTMQSNIDLNYSFSRYDSQQDFEPILQKELTESQSLDVLFTGLGHQMTSFNKKSTWFLGTWDKRPLSRETKIILLSNGVQGAAGIKLDLNAIQANSTILLTGGTLSGCTMITGVKDSIFYALHAGTGTPTEKWKTGREGVRDTMVLYNRLNPTFPVAGGDYSNSNLLDLLNSFKSGTLSYSGKSPFQIQGAANDTRILNYSSTGLGVSFTLIRKNKEGVVSVQTLLEAGELSPTSKKKNSPTTTRNFPVPVYKYRAQTSVIHKLL